MCTPFWYADFDADFPQLLQLIASRIVQSGADNGAGFWGIFFKVMLPMSLPILVVAIILQVTGIWNDFLFGIVYTRPEAPMTVQLNNIVNSTYGEKI